MTVFLLILAVLLAFTTSCASWSAAALQAAPCSYGQTAQIGGDTGGTTWNDSYVAKSQPCGVVAPSFMNFTYGTVIQSMVTVYNPSDFTPSHGKWLDNNY